MRTIWAAAVLFLGLIATPLVHACRVRMLPDIDHLDRYKSVFVGEVSSVTQAAYEKQESGCVNLGRYAPYCQVSDIAPPYNVTAIKRVPISGEASSVVTVQIERCGVSVPDIGAYGVFFLPKNSHEEVTVVYQSDGFLFANLLLKLGAKNPTVSLWDKLQSDN